MLPDDGQLCCPAAFAASDRPCVVRPNRCDSGRRMGAPPKAVSPMRILPVNGHLKVPGFGQVKVSTPARQGEVI